MIEHIQLNNLSECQRLFHGRGHAYANLAHVNVDWLAPVVLITLACGFWLQQSIAPTWLALVLSCLLLLSIHGILVYLVTLTTVEKQQINSKCRQIVKRYSK